ncbi:Phage major capsid protein E [Thiohalospira halophila DSM 15071]|uniref:Phage major capsid protein E n=1 Tax=Thiohalospira halophila DSM 15071 TaxID=1123397 RepID=A0A1I1UIV6_9GAMM|nr:major capsid protein [Thiohalospira halophila]SFD67870.1 Phage major capsid protein E [Thiohalospira halophila DSM 15071]
MATLDVFNSDAFSVRSLTASVNETPAVPGRIGALGLFESDGITTTTAQVEKRKDGLGLVPAGQRGSAATHGSAPKRQMIPVNTTHLPQRDTIMADEIANMRAFGEESEEEMVERYVRSRQASLRRNLDATIEYQRASAIQGKILDSDGAVLVDLLSDFDVEQTTQDIKLSDSTTKVRTKVLEAKRKAEKVLGGSPISGWRVLCGYEFFDAFISHSDVESAYERWNQGEMLRNDPRNAFPFGGVQWEEYNHTVGERSYVPKGEAYLVPEGVPGMFITRFAPADYVDSVGTVGLPMYSSIERLPHGKGVDLEVQSNPISLCTRPDAVVKITKS